VKPFHAYHRTQQWDKYCNQVSTFPRLVPVCFVVLFILNNCVWTWTSLKVMKMQTRHLSIFLLGFRHRKTSTYLSASKHKHAHSSINTSHMSHCVFFYPKQLWRSDLTWYKHALSWKTLISHKQVKHTNTKILCSYHNEKFYNLRKCLPRTIWSALVQQGIGQNEHASFLQAKNRHEDTWVFFQRVSRVSNKQSIKCKIWQ